jgi:hypothetical protein
MRSVLYKRKLGDWISPELLVFSCNTSLYQPLRLKNVKYDMIHEGYGLQTLVQTHPQQPHKIVKAFTEYARKIRLKN